MAYDFHEDRELYFEHQTLTTEQFIIPFIEKQFEITPGMKVLEIGCAEAGVLKAFTKRGLQAVGVDLVESKLQIARRMMQDELQGGKVTFINKNIYEESFKTQFRGQFNLIILKDVIEHIPEQQHLLSYLHTFLCEGGVIFFAFPPWQMPFGGHQQMCRSVLSKVPYFHLLPMAAYRWILRRAGEKENKIEALAQNKRTGISIERFERILKKTNYHILNRNYFLFNPIYKYKFGLNPRRQWPVLAGIPYLRDFLTTAVYYLVEPA